MTTEQQMSKITKREALSIAIADLRHETAKLEMPETTWDHFVDLTNRIEAEIAELFEPEACDDCGSTLTVDGELVMDVYACPNDEGYCLNCCGCTEHNGSGYLWYKSATPGTAEHTDDAMDTCVFCNETFLEWQADDHERRCEGAIRKAE